MVKQFLVMMTAVVGLAACSGGSGTKIPVCMAGKEKVAMPQKHLFRLISASGKRMAWMVCVTMPVALM